MVRDVFQLAKENAPAIIFIDKIDAIATAQFDAQTGTDWEVQRILMELLNQVPPPTFTLHMSMYRSSWQDAKYTPLSASPVENLTVLLQGFCFFFSSFVLCCYTITKKYYFYSVQKGMPVVGPDSLREKV